MKNISVWFNRAGVDEKFFEGKGEWNQEMLDKIIENVSFVEGAELDDFDIEEEGDGWVMYGFDGIGVFVVDAGKDPEKCKEEYNDSMGWSD